MEDNEYKDNEIEGYAQTMLKALQNMVHDYSMSSKSVVHILYASPAVAFSKSEEYIVNNEKPGPLITFNLRSMNKAPGQPFGGFLSMHINNTNVMKGVKLQAPLVYELRYEVVINAISEMQADILLEQILLATNMNRPYVSEYNGQVVTIVSDGDVESLSPDEIGENEDKVSRRILDVKIQRAYLNYPLLNYNLKQIEPGFKLYVIEGIN